MLIASGDVDMAKVLDGVAKQTAWVVIVLKIIAAFGILYAIDVFAFALCQPL
jgi:hypothetical protein